MNMINKSKWGLIAASITGLGVIALALFGGGAFLSGPSQAANCLPADDLQADTEDVILICDNEEKPPPVVACGIWVPDVGDAEELGLIGTDAPAPATILVATDSDGTNIIAVLSSGPFVGTDTYQIPPELQSASYWYKIDGCGRWHGGEELGFD